MCRGLDIFDIHIAQHNQNKEHHNDHRNGALIKTNADCKTHTGRCPKACRRCQAADSVLLGDQNGSRAEKADSADHLRAQTQNITIDVRRYAHRDGVFTDHHGRCRANAHHHMRAKARRLLMPPPFKAD